MKIIKLFARPLGGITCSNHHAWTTLGIQPQPCNVENLSYLRKP